jgi:Flp pilus assembly protein TadG
MFHAILQQLAVRCRLLRPVTRLARNDSGATAVEFGLVAAPFLALLVALVQTGLVFFAQRVLDEITAEASRYVMTGQAQVASMTQAGFQSYLCTSSNTAGLVSLLFKCNNLMVNVQNYASFSAANTPCQTLSFNSNGTVSNTWVWSPGNPGDIVVVQILYQWPVMLGPLGFNLATYANGNHLLCSTSVFKNEPY